MFAVVSTAYWIFQNGFNNGHHSAPSHACEWQAKRVWLLLFITFTRCHCYKDELLLFSYFMEVRFLPNGFSVQSLAKRMDRLTLYVCGGISALQNCQLCGGYRFYALSFKSNSFWSHAKTFRKDVHLILSFCAHLSFFTTTHSFQSPGTCSTCKPLLLQRHFNETGEKKSENRWILGENVGKYSGMVIAKQHAEQRRIGSVETTC